MAMRITPAVCASHYAVSCQINIQIIDQEARDYHISKDDNDKRLRLGRRASGFIIVS